MSKGLFAVNCPDCGAEMEVHHDGSAQCPSCASAYLHRFGHLIPRAGSPSADTSATATTAPRPPRDR